MHKGHQDMRGDVDTRHKGHEKKAGHNHHDHHAHMVADFRKRFWISLIVTIPILILSPMIQRLIGLGDSIRFPSDLYLLFALSSIVFFYGGYPFLKGFFDEVKSAKPGMMTLIAIAITTAYLYSSVVVFGLSGKMFFWELATLIDIMLLGHWIEMKSIMGASRALEELARLMPSDAHKLMADGTIKDVPLSELTVGDRVLVKPGEKIPADGEVVEGETSVNESMLTEGKFGVTDVITFAGNSNQKELLKYAASVEAHSEHPIAKGIASSSKEIFSIEGFRAIRGKGAEGKVNGSDVKVVSPGYLSRIFQLPMSGLRSSPHRERPWYL